MKIAFYKGKGGTFNKLIKWWTRSEITHVELIIDDIWYSSSHIDGGVRGKVIDYNPDHWDIYELNNIDEYRARKVIADAIGCGYDWTGIVGSQVLPFGIQWPYRYFCSELVGAALMVKSPQRYAPNELLRLLKNKDKIVEG